MAQVDLLLDAKAAALCIAAVAFVIFAITDELDGKIYNFVTFPTWIAGVILCTYQAVVQKDYQELIIRLLVCLVFFGLGFLGISGLGDIKMIMASVMLLGLWPVAVAAGASLIPIYADHKFLTHEAIAGLSTELRLSWQRRRFEVNDNKKIRYGLYFAIGMIPGLITYVCL